MAHSLYILSLYCGLGFGIQSYHFHSRTQDEFIVPNFQVRLDARQQEYMPSASFYFSSPEKLNKYRGHHSHRFGFNKKSGFRTPNISEQHIKRTTAMTSMSLLSSTIFKTLHSTSSSQSPYLPTPAPVIRFRFGVVADLDQNSKVTISLENNTNDKTAGKVWVSYLKEGMLSIQINRIDPESSNATVEWESGNPQPIFSGLNYGGRGMEFSTFNVFNGKLLACDDKTGVVYELPRNKFASFDIVPIPWVILADRNSTSPKGFQCEWATIKNNDLWIGSHGINDLNENGEIIESVPRKFVARITPEGVVTYLDWSKNFDKISDALNIPKPGYVRHECNLWSDIHQKWIFMPRRISKEKFNPYSFARSGSNVVILADENFENIQIQQIGKLIPTHGFTDSKFIPGTNDRIFVAIKVVETEDTIESYILVFDLSGHILLPETKFSDQKYEGIEFL